MWDIHLCFHVEDAALDGPRKERSAEESDFTLWQSEHSEFCSAAKVMTGASLDCTGGAPFPMQIGDGGQLRPDWLCAGDRLLVVDAIRGIGVLD